MSEEVNSFALAAVPPRAVARANNALIEIIA
jgi:hypothetical protein